METIKQKDQMPMLIPYDPDEFWQKMRELIKEEVSRLQHSGSVTEYTTPGLTYKPLYKIEEVCHIFMITKPTVYEWIRIGTLRPFKVKSRVYFLWEDIKGIMKTG